MNADVISVGVRNTPIAMTARRSRLSTGFTLVEVMVASGIMAIALSALMAAFILGKRSTVRMNKHLVMMHQIRSEMERLNAHDFDDTELDPGLHVLTNGHYNVSAGLWGTKDINMQIFWDDPSKPTNVWITMFTSVSSGLH